jgi:hypothetical protein
MTQPLRIDAAAEHESAVLAVAALHGKLKLQNAFVGTVAFSAWTGRRVEAGAVDLLAMLSPERMRQVPMMASNHGFRVDPQEIERAEELDLIPLSYHEIRIHVLMATNALYGRMVAESVEAQIGETTVRVIRAEDLALLFLIAEDEPGVEELISRVPDFDLASLNQKLTAIGLARRAIIR